ncbi:MAG: nuclear transport factor 2 family protein [Candidatus Krumholzibacteriia bacterium]
MNRRPGPTVTPLLAAVLTAIVLAGCCEEPPDLDQEKIELLQVHLADIRAHKDRDVEGLLRTVGPDLRMVRDGAVTVRTKDELAARFREVFAGAEYLVYEDLQVPHAEVSDDGTMGWVISRMRIERLEPDGAGGRSAESSVYAGIMTYRKVRGRWQKTANVSTFAPPE